MGMVSGVTETEWCGLGHWIYGTARVGGSRLQQPRKCAFLCNVLVAGTDLLVVSRV